MVWLARVPSPLEPAAAGAVEAVPGNAGVPGRPSHVLSRGVGLGWGGGAVEGRKEMDPRNVTF